MTTALRSTTSKHRRSTFTSPTTRPTPNEPHRFQDDDMHASHNPAALRSDLLAPDSPPPPGLRREPPAAAEAVDESLAARRPVARCADGNGTMTALFFSDHVVDIARAKAICALCPLQAECLAGALQREEPWGVWGGELLSGGRIVANKRPCGRPPKHPRPEVVYDEMGPVGVVA